MSTIKTSCPICKKQGLIEYWSGPFGTEEEYFYCDRCNYSYEFAYGNYREVVHNKQFVYDYHLYSNKANARHFLKKINRATFMAKRNWKKFKKSNSKLDVENPCVTPYKKGRKKCRLN